MATYERGAPDYEALFSAVPAACVVLDRDLVIVAANKAYTDVTGRPASDLLGRAFFDAFPPEPAEPSSHGAEVQRLSLEAVLASGEANMLMLHRFAIPGPGGSGRFEPRWWNVVNQPLTGADGRVELIIHRVDDVTEFIRAEQGDSAAAPEDAEARAPRAELFTRTQELQRANVRLQESTVRTRDVALTLQRAMLATPDLAGHPEIAVRYRPALRGMNACGDWYDVIDLPDGRLALTVGDVVGHGVDAASVMGTLRSALNAAVRVADGPSGALETLGLYARAQERATATTTFACQLFPVSRLLTYSSAGHPPPVLMHADGTSLWLDDATDPPLGVRIEHVPRPQATVDFRKDDTLVLYTDGLIERRGEDLDAGLSRLLDAVREMRELPPPQLADELLRTMADPAGQQDDISLLVIRL
ncbi:PP2C family protein-serine/threonine phosphatase [Streptomyces sp. NPDC090052]|uniref:PP2C family protein-serine/threonine phosphatase n=1 Tax=unclassified Streptomyces TaxID=2593676 RepID=UPI0022586628|nr:SpoIIE family protein phosphatase [Streptomyces sp. NBC_01306]MCX4724726.1 SpoIIE family protein phosphatase [Streptomyces sp. NBC_01306]